MKPASKLCILCQVPGRPKSWNGLEILVCPSCGLAWRANFDLPEDYYNSVALSTDELKNQARKRNAEDQLRTIQKFLPRVGVCDVGCSEGTFLTVLRDSGYQGYSGIEPGEKGLKICAERGLKVFPGTIEDVPAIARQTQISAITMFHLLEHLDDPISSLRLINQALFPGAVLVVETPDAQAPLQRATNHHNHLVYPEHLFYWNELALKKLLTQTGFKVAAVKRRTFDWRQAPIGRSLLRLGLRTTTETQVGNNQKTVITKVANKEPATNWLRSMARSFLAHLVHWLRRDDYILVVARRM
jgi:2-polyprenyl-3-methyl-5-hydroxy-6-metoxy-1,4-benzoquinol methylase